MVAPAEAVFLDAKLEAELVELPDDEALELLQSVGQEESGMHALARVGFDTLGLQTYLTAGPKESRAWTIPKGATAPEAAGVIHTDFQKGFIKAEVVSFDDLVEAGSMAGGEGQGQGPHRGQGLRRWPTATSSSSASTSDHVTGARDAHDAAPSHVCGVPLQHQPSRGRPSFVTQSDATRRSPALDASIW